MCLTINRLAGIQWRIEEVTVASQERASQYITAQNCCFYIDFCQIYMRYKLMDFVTFGES